jgi:hypothetical protein
MATESFRYWKFNDECSSRGLRPHHGVKIHFLADPLRKFRGRQCGAATEERFVNTRPLQVVQDRAATKCL